MRSSFIFFLLFVMLFLCGCAAFTQHGQVYKKAEFYYKAGDFDGAVTNSIDALSIKPTYQTVAATTPVTINPEMNYKPKEETVDRGLSISEGTVAYIGAVLINWVSETSDKPHKTKEYVIRRELERYNIKEGKLYSSQNIEDARRRILNLRHFIKRADPKIALEPQSSKSGKKNEPQKVTVNINVEESRKSMMVGVAGGYGSESGLFGALDIRDDNILGKAFKLQLRGEIGTKELRTGQIVFNSPWILNTPTSLDASLYKRRRTVSYMPDETTTEDNTSSYRDDSIGASFTVGRSITRKLDLSIGLRNESITYKQWDETLNLYVTPEVWYRNNINNDPTLTELAALAPSKGKTRSIKAQLKHDTRNYLTSMFDPNSGSFLSASAEISGLGGDRFQKIETESSLFVPTWWKLVLVFHLKTGYIAGKDAKYLRFERYYLGGIQSIRGYGTNAITPPGEYEQYGGNRMGQLNVECRFPITNRRVRGIVFFDAGQTWGGNQSLVKDFSPKKSVGLGIRFDLLGALARIEYGYPLNVPVGNGKPKGGKIDLDIEPSFSVAVKF